MSATSGISPSQDLLAQFSAAIDSKETRFLKVSIQNESLVHDLSIPVEGSIKQDLSKLQQSTVLKDDVPAYILTKLDEPPTEWLAISYVPDAAKVRDKMLYAATRNSLMKALGSNLFTDALFATSKADLTPEAYEAHQRHIAAPKPLSAREQQMADIRAAESGGIYEGSRARVNHIGTGVGLNWSDEVEHAVKELGAGQGCRLVVIKIDTPSETLVLDSVSDISVESLGSTLPSSDPCYAFFAWPHEDSTTRRDIVFIYSCPSSSPVKHRMVYSSGSSSVFQSAKSIIASSAIFSQLASRKVETSDPTELTEAYLKLELGLTGATSSLSSRSDSTDGSKPFAKPRGPTKRR
ncbi:hypothetical protein BD779DRAFT_842149 [Infundibulicybe gibba]|nr:hypothetical protein BD779DRAFT_842149 [Infundibulicybe gibba]